MLLEDKCRKGVQSISPEKRAILDRLEQSLQDSPVRTETPQACESREDDLQVAGKQLAGGQELRGYLQRACRPLNENEKNTSAFSDLVNNTFVVAGLASALACLLVFFQGATPNGFIFAMFYVPTLLAISLVRSAGRIIKNAESDSEPNRKSLWYGKGGSFIMFFAVLCPCVRAVTMLYGQFSAAQLSSFECLALFVPLANLLAWAEIRKKDKRYPCLRRLFLALAILYESSMTFLSLLHAERTYYFLPVLYGLTLSCSVYLSYRISFRVLPLKERLETAYAFVLLSLIAGLPNVSQIVSNLQILALDSRQAPLAQWAYDGLVEKAVAEQIADGIPGSVSESLKDPPFLFLSSQKSAELYYRLSGLPLWTHERAISCSDFFYGVPSVGPVEKSLSMKESLLNASVDAETLSAAFDWTMEIKSGTYGPGKEARLQIILPKGAVVDDLCLYSDRAIAKPEQTRHLEILPARRTYVDRIMSLRDPVIASLLSPEKLELQCAPVFGGKSLKLGLHICAPFATASDADEAFLDFPYIANSNLAKLAASSVQIETKGNLTDESGRKVKSKEYRSLEASHAPLKLRSSLTDKKRSFVLKAPCGKSLPVTCSVDKKKSAGQRIVLAIDASAGAGRAKAVLLDFIAKNESMLSSICIARPESGVSVYAGSKEALAALRNSPFRGGAENWSLLCEAVNQARAARASVVWVHARKPWNMAVDNFAGIGAWTYDKDKTLPCPSDIGGICGKDIQIYDFQTEKGDNEIVERLHAQGKDVSAFVHIEPGLDMRSSLRSLFRSLKDGSQSGLVRFSKLKGQLNQGLVRIESDAVLPLLDSHSSNRQVDLSASSKEDPEFKYLDTKTALLCLEENRYFDKKKRKQLPALSQNSEPSADEFAIVGSSNVVRVSNLAGLEALLNILANGLEVGLLCCGTPMLVVGIAGVCTRAGKLRCFFGLLFVISGLAIPGVINWLLASSRDGGGFS